MKVELLERVAIPGWVRNHASFRRWVRSAEFLDSGQYAWLGNKVWVDVSIERDSHNQIKTRIGQTLMNYLDAHQLGRWWGDRMLLTHVKSGLSTEPDGIFATW